MYTSDGTNPNCAGRVLMLLQNARYPHDRRVRQEAMTLVKAGYAVNVIAPSRGGQALHEVVDGVHVYRYPLSHTGNGFLGYVFEYGFSMAATLLLSAWIFVRRGFDVVHAHNPPDVFVLIAAIYKVFGKKFVFDHHDLSPEMYDARFPGRSRQGVRRVLVFFEKLSCRLADHVIATNDSYKAIQMSRGGVPEQRISVVRNGPDLKRLQRVAPDEQLRSRAPTIIGYLGAMSHQDGIDYLIRALHHLVHDFGRRDFFCVLIGQGVARERLMALGHELGLDDYLLFTGYVSENDLLRYLSSVDVFVDPDPSNPFTDRSTMIKMMEYMAYERPIVAFDLTEHRVTAQRAAAYVKPNDEREFARTIISLMDDPQRREEMGSFGRRRVERELAWIHQEGCLLSAYRQLQAPATSPRATAEDGQAAAKRKRCHRSQRVSASR